MRILPVCILLIALYALALPAVGYQITYGDFKGVKFLRCYDGDTCSFNILGVPAVIGIAMPVRVRGIDTPELRGRCPKEKELAREAKKVANDMLKAAKHIHLERISRGKYFRLVADIVADGKSLAEVLILNDLAVRYEGGAKIKDWCAE